MKDLFASLYEWFGLIPLYSTDMGDMLRGFDVTCTDYINTPWYLYIGWIMVGVTAFVYALQYHIIDSARWNKKQHWWLFALVIVLINFIAAFSISFNEMRAGDYCKDLHPTTADCLGFGLSNAIWSLFLFVLITSIPFIRKASTNCRHTTFWKP